MTDKNAQAQVTDLLERAKARGYGIQRVAKGTGFDKETLRRWKNGINEPSLSHFTQFEDRLKKLIKTKRKTKSKKPEKIE